MYIDGDKITIQEADYIEDGMIIEIEGENISLFEIPTGWDKIKKCGLLCKYS